MWTDRLRNKTVELLKAQIKHYKNLKVLSSSNKLYNARSKESLNQADPEHFCSKTWDSGSA